MAWKHRTVDYDPGAGTLTCSNCGEVPLAYKEGRPKCSTALREQRGHPEPKGRRTKADGDRKRTKQGYIAVKVGGRWFLQHRLVMAEVLGRPLVWTRGLRENVHHKNGVKDDNDPGNLELWVSSQPPGQRPEDLVAWARMILERYG